MLTATRFDLARVSIATAVGGATGVGLAVALFRQAQSRPHQGPTSATLDEGFSLLLGAGLGLFIGSLLGALLSRRGSRMLAGVVAGFAGYVLAVAPYVFFTGAGDLTLSEELEGLAAFALLFFPPFVILGAFIGALVGTTWPGIAGGDSGEPTAGLG